MGQPVEPIERISVGPVEFVSSDLASATNTVLSLAESHVPLSVRLANAYCVVSAAANLDYRKVLNGPGLTFPDGAPVSLVMRLKHHMRPNIGADAATPSRVRGPSLFRSVLAESQGRNVGHFFLGTTSETLAMLTSNVAHTWPQAKVSGTFAPPYAPVSEELLALCASAIENSGANLVWVALGTPKQDLLAQLLAERLGVTVVAVGAAFDFVAGSAPEAPPVFQQTGTEWLFRLFSEPRRLWRRYLIGNVQFIYLVVKHDLFRRAR